MTLNTEVDQGRQADQLLDNPIYKEATQAVRQAIMDSWAKSPVRDIEGAHELRLMLHSLNQIEQYIKTVAETGKMAQIQIEHQKTMAERFKRYLD